MKISTQQIASTFGDASVTLPGGVTPGHPDWPDHWPTWNLPHGGDHAFLTEWRKWQAAPDTYTPPPGPDR
ncbi:MAG: hypothetical protein JJU42_15670 [Rhodobacteraceae bacterium]|nr:hypothetical protein [Paracoccaceae bacterium]